MPVDEPVTVVYDAECPVCDFYCRRIVPRAAGEVTLVDARSGPDLLSEITARGWDIDEGMVVKVGGELYYGAEAIHRLALTSDGRGLVKPMSRLFRRRACAMRLYPMLRTLRNGLLRLLGKTRINNLGRAGRDRF